MMQKRFAALLILGSIFWGCSRPDVSPGRAQNPLDRPIWDFSATPQHELRLICALLKVPGAFEHRPDEVVPHDNLVIPKGTMREALEATIKRYGGGYKYGFRNGVLAIWPTKPQRSPLDIRIKNFHADNDVLLGTVERVGRDVGIAPTGSDINDVPVGPPVNLQMKNAMAREILDTIARNDTRCVWEYFPATKEHKAFVAVSR